MRRCIQLEVTISGDPKMSREEGTFAQARERPELGSHARRLFRSAKVPFQASGTGHQRTARKMTEIGHRLEWIRGRPHDSNLPRRQDWGNPSSERPI